MMLDEVKEASEPGSHNSIDLSMKQEDSFILIKLETLAIENDKLRSENEGLSKKIKLLSSQIQELERQKDLQKKEAIQEVHAELSKKITQELQMQHKQKCILTVSRIETSSIICPSSMMSATQSLLSEIAELKSKLSKKCEEINENNLEIIRLKEEHMELTRENRGLTESLQCSKLESIKKPVTWSEKESRNYSYFGSGLLEEIKEEMELAKERNLILESKVEDLKAAQAKMTQLNGFAKADITDFYKRIYELYLRKETYLEEKQNRILSLCKTLEDDFQAEDLKSENTTWGLVILFIIILCLFIYKQLPNKL